MASASIRASASLAQRVAVVTVAVTATHAFKHNVAEFTLCEGPSMMPTFHAQGDIVVVNHTVARGNADDVHVGDVVVAKSPTTPGGNVCKRIMAKEGSEVRIFSETGNTIRRRKGETPKTFVVPRGHVWVQGDNVNNSSDSREYGPVPVALLKGRVDYRVFPFAYYGAVERRIPISWVKAGFVDDERLDVVSA